MTDEVERLAATLRRESTAGITAAELATTLSVLQRVRGNLIELDREDFGLTWNQALETGGVLVGKDVTITLDLQGAFQD